VYSEERGIGPHFSLGPAVDGKLPLISLEQIKAFGYGAEGADRDSRLELDGAHSSSFPPVRFWQESNRRLYHFEAND
jgi:hypothetical protein